MDIRQLISGIKSLSSLQRDQNLMQKEVHFKCVRLYGRWYRWEDSYNVIKNFIIAAINDDFDSFDTAIYNNVNSTKEMSKVLEESRFPERMSEVISLLLSGFGVRSDEVNAFSEGFVEGATEELSKVVNLR